MNNFKTLLVLTALSLALAILFFYYPQIIVPWPYGTFTFLFVMLVCFWTAFRLNPKSPEMMQFPQVSSRIATLKKYFMVMGLFFFFDGIAHVAIPALYPYDILASHMHTFSHAIFFIGNALIIRIPVSFMNTRWVNPASWLMLALGAVTVIWRVIHTDKLLYIFGPENPPIVATDQMSGLFFLAANTIGLIIPGFYLIYRGLKVGDFIARSRAVFLGSGMVVFFSVGPVIDLLHNQYTQLVIHLLLAVAFFLMGASAFYKETEIVTEKSSQPNV